MKAIILCAGYGTRLMPVSQVTSKPLIDVGRRPIVDHIVEKVAALDAIDKEGGILVLSNDTFYDDFLRWREASAWRNQVRVLNDGSTSPEQRRGAIGAIEFGLEHVDAADGVLIVGGDNVFTFYLDKLFKVFSDAGSHAIALYDVGSLDLARLYATVALDGDGRVADMVEKPPEPATSLASVCIYMYGPSIKKRLEEYKDGGGNMDATGHFPCWLHKVEPVYGCQLEGKWFDIGGFPSLEEARAYFIEQRSDD